MDEIGFQVRMASTAKVIYGSEIAHANSIPPGNRKWITKIITT